MMIFDSSEFYFQFSVCFIGKPCLDGACYALVLFVFTVYTFYPYTIFYLHFRPSISIGVVIRDLFLV